jgi:phosphatidyl-myo-inositol dimannoside synthase
MPSKRPRLLLVLTEFPPSFGGMQTHAVHLARHLQGQGFPVCVATYRCQTPPGFDEQFGFPVYRCLSRIAYHRNLRTLEALARETKAELLYSSTVYYGQLAERTGLKMLCRSAGNDVLRPWIAWPYRPMSSAFGNLFFEEHLYHRFRAHDWPERLESVLLEKRQEVMRDSARAMSHIFANSQFTAELLGQLGIAESMRQTLPGGVDSERFAPREEVTGREERRRLRQELGLPPDAYLLMTACRLVPKKGLDTLLGAFAALRKRMRDAHLVIIGSGRERAEVERLSAKLGLADRVILTGMVPHEKLPQYYWAADQFLLASREHVNRHNGLRDVETMGRVLCEANAAGVPVIAARSGGIPSVIEHQGNGLLFPESDVRALAAWMETLREDRYLAGRLRENGLRRARVEFDWKVICSTHQRQMLALAG